MGQYYYPVLSDAVRREDFTDHLVATAYSHDFDNGLKLMEHSYIGNNFVAVIEAMLAEPKRLVWAGDYADPEPTVTRHDLGMSAEEWKIEFGDSEPDPSPNLYEIASHRKNLKVTEKPAVTVVWNFILNHDKQQYVNLSRVSPDSWGWRIHPLPLLTAEGNGRGGGDFRGDDQLVGFWARDLVSVSNTVPDGWEELTPNFTE